MVAGGLKITLTGETGFGNYKLGSWLWKQMAEVE